MVYIFVKQAMWYLNYPSLYTAINVEIVQCLNNNVTGSISTHNYQSKEGKGRRKGKEKKNKIRIRRIPLGFV